jgi:RimJ/RimL family protein N-acetyltransferase
VLRKSSFTPTMGGNPLEGGEKVICQGRRDCIDKKGTTFWIGGCQEKDFCSLLEMYRLFSPKPASQGLPPPDPKGCLTWLRGLFEAAENFLAWGQEKVIGHAALIPDFHRHDAEFLIFVDQSFRNRGIGTALTRMAMDRAKAMRLQTVWLTVEIYNLRAIGLYRRFGFTFRNTYECERTMVLLV